MQSLHVLAGVGVGLCIGLVLLARLRVPAPDLARPLLGFVACVALWAFGDSLAALAKDMTQKQVGVAIFYTGVIYLPPLWWMLALRWADDRGCVLPLYGRAWTQAPLLWASAMWLAMITNPWHGLFLTPVVGGRNLYEPLWFVMAVPNYLLIVGVLAVEWTVARRVRAPDVRWQAGFVIAATLVTLIANAAYVSRAPSFNGTLLVLGLSSGLVFIGMTRQGVFGVLPVAMRTLAEGDPDGLVVVRTGGRVAYLSARARDLLGPLGVALETRFPDALRESLRNADGSLLAGHEPDWEKTWWESLARPEGALFCVGDDGARWLHLSAREIVGRRGRVRAVCLRLRDVTAERRAEVQLRRARRLESVAELAMGVGHDFQSLLAVVRGNAELLISDHPEDASVQRKAARIRDAGERATELARQLQLYAGGADPVRSFLELSEVMGELSEFLRPDLDPKVRLELALADEPLPVEADATQLRQILLNLVVNACEALPEGGGAISTSTGSCWLDPARTENLVAGEDEPAGQYGYVAIEDSGCGMDAATQERLFEPYFSTKGKQRGVGLSSTLGVVRAHGGLLQLETRLGVGSCFRLYLPLAS